MTTLTATRGLPASGKTTHARQMLAEAEPGTLVRLNRDDLRASMHGTAHYIHVTEQQITIAQHGTARTMLRAGVNVVVDDTNLRARHLRALAELAWQCGAEFEVADFCYVPLDVCIDRDAARGSPVGEAVIRSMYERYLAFRRLPLPLPEKPEQVQAAPCIPEASLPAAVMVDVDGTTALHGDRVKLVNAEDFDDDERE